VGSRFRNAGFFEFGMDLLARLQAQMMINRLPLQEDEEEEEE